MLKIAESIDKLSIFVGRVCGPLYLLAILTMAFEVIARKFFNAPQVWSLEIVIALVGTAWMLSAAVVTQQNRHITVTVMEIVISKSLWHKFQIVSLIISILAIVALMFAVEAGFTKAIST
ncbi:MAG: TRAP transporter small permease subunit, partial [Pseudomonadota bacterium]